MGGGESKANSVVVDEDLPKVSHQKFANRRFITDNNGQQFIIIKLSVPSERQYELWKQSLKSLNDYQFLLLPKLHSFSKTGLCGTNGIVEIIYEKYPFILSDQIHNRQCLNSKFFQESQLWYLSFTLLEAANCFHRQGRKIADIRPQNIFISEDGSVKIACRQSWPLEITNYQKSFQKQTTYVSPQEVSDLLQRKIQSSADFQLSQTFSIGLTILDATTLGDSSVLYINNGKFDQNGLEARLKDLDNLNYGVYFRLLIKNMLEIAPQKRTKAVDLYNWLLPYEDEINNFTTFEPKNLPSKFPPLINTIAFKSNSNSVQNYALNSNYASNQTYPIKFQYSSFNPSTITSYQPQRPTYQPPRITQTSYNPPQFDTKPLILDNKPGLFNNKPILSSNNSASSNQYYKPIVVTNPPQMTNDYVHIPQTLNQNNIVESTYVPYTSKFSLDKIDEQLNNSRKMFPS